MTAPALGSRAPEGEDALRGEAGGPAAARRWITRKAISFNYLPSRYAHPSHWGPLLPLPLRGPLPRTARGEARLSRLLLSAHGLLGKWHADFSRGNQRLALAFSHLPRLALYAGAFFHAQALAQLIEKKSIAEIKARIGGDVYEFALRRAALFQKWRPFDPPAPEGGPGLGEAIERAGLHSLAVCFAGTGHALQGRLHLRWPVGEGPKMLETEDPGSPAAGLFLARLLCKEIAPEWTPHLL